MIIFRSAYTVIFLFFAITVANAQAPNIGMSVTINTAVSIIDEDIASARKEGLHSALRGAIGEIMESMIDSIYREKYAPLIEQHIFSNSFRYIIKYEVLRESTILDQSYTLSVKAIVDSDKLEQDLDRIGVLQNRLSSPDIVLVITEQFPESMLMKKGQLSKDLITMELKKSGFFLIESDQRPDEMRYAYGGDIGEVIAIGNDVGGDIVVFGISKVTLKEEADNNSGKMNNIEVSINLKAVKLDNGIILSESSVVAVYPHSNLLIAAERALRKASISVVKKLSEDINSRWKTEVNAGRRVVLRVNNVTNISRYNSVKNLLNYFLPGHVEVESRAFDGSSAEYVVVASTTGYKIASELEGKRFDGFNFKILNSSLHALSVALVTR